MNYLSIRTCYNCFVFIAGSRPSIRFGAKSEEDRKTQEVQVCER